MASEVDNVMAATTEKETMIAGTFPQIIVTGTEEKPFYQIMYIENEDGEIHLGFGSYDLAYVFQWLKEFFGVTHASAVNPESLRPKGRWVMLLYTTTSERGRVIGNKKFTCSECGHGNGRKQSNYCPNCGADMREGNE